VLVVGEATYVDDVAPEIGEVSPVQPDAEAPEYHW
jgi:hypothetical protein